MTIFDDPNREAVGLAPIWTGADEGDGEVTPSDGGYDPGEDTVDDVKLYAEAHPNETEQILQAETSGKNRTTLVAWLEERLG